MSPAAEPLDLARLCGLWVDGSSLAHLCLATAGGERVTRTEVFEPFVWISGPPPTGELPGLRLETLKGVGPFRHLVHANEEQALDPLVEALGKGACEALRPLESQFLLQRRARLFAELPFAQLRRCQLDIETGSEDGSFSDASRPGDRVLAIGLRQGGRSELLCLEAATDEAERALLESFQAALLRLDPDVIEGHNLFRFDLDYLRQRCRRQGLPCAWGRFGQRARFRSSRLKVAERWVDFPRCDLPGRTIVDTYLLVQLYDIGLRELASYGLKEVALHFDLNDEQAGTRTYIPGAEIARVFVEDRSRFCAYLEDDLREVEGLASLLLPTYFEQVRTFPLLLQEATLRGTTAKIDLLFLEAYYHARQACPVPPPIEAFEGGYTRSYTEGVFRKVLHFDVASLYPSLLLLIGRNPANDTLGVFMPLLRSLRDYRLRYKQLARSATDPEQRAEAQARQASFKILINSFYGYLGFSGARFGDGALAAEVTRRGRELLQGLLEAFAREGCTLLEADTDGIYLSSEIYYDEPEALLGKVKELLPQGIELECDGRYEAMFCYKAKNYALWDGARIQLRGSALRSRGIEPFLQRLTDCTLRHLLGAAQPGEADPKQLLEEFRQLLRAQKMPVTLLAKTESLSQGPEAYEKHIAAGGKPRRASAEAALHMNPRPRLGDRVSYYLGPKAKGKTADWQRARPLSDFDPLAAPYDPEAYLKKLDDWLERYGPFLGEPSPGAGSQSEWNLD